MQNSISDNLQRLQTARSNIAEAITAKGGIVGANDGFEEFSADIDTIPTSSPTFAFLFVTTESGVTVTVSKGGTTLDTQTATSQNLQLCFDIPESGTWTVSGTNGESTTISITTKNVYYIELISPIYGVSWDKSSTKTLTRTDASSGFSNPVPYIEDGSTVGSSPFDTIMPWSGMVKEEIDGNMMVKIPKFYYKITSTSSELTFQITNYPKQGFKISPAHRAQNENDVIKEYVYVGRYKCDSNYKSISGQTPLTNITRSTARLGCRSLGENYDQLDFATLWTIRILYLVEFANWDCQRVIGYGGGSGNCGYTDYMNYHTGTTKSGITVSGIGIQYRWIEGLWENCNEWIDGITISGYRVYVCNDRYNYSDSTAGYIDIGVRSSTTGNIKSLHQYTGTATFDVDWALYPDTTVSNTSYNSYVCDYCAYSNTDVTTSYGGSSSASYGSGLFAFRCNNNSASSTIGARLIYYPQT